MESWEDIIIKIRKDPQYADLVEKAYFDADLELNVQRFLSSKEYHETLNLITKYSGESRNLRILDVGAGNGISSIAFAKQGYTVSVVEPDKSNTVGSGAINILKEKFQLDNLTVFDSFGENLPFEDKVFDIVYIRQAMHHAADLNKFVGEAARTLKNGGLFLTIRDHVIYDAADKAWFLKEHPLHKFYGGENAFTELEYKDAMHRAGLKVIQTLRYYDNLINYFPITEEEYSKELDAYQAKLRKALRGRIGMLASINTIFKAYIKFTESRNGSPLDEKHVPGRMYTFIAKKVV